MIRIDEKLNIVVPVSRNDKTVDFYAMSSPISREVFESNFRALSRTHSEITGREASYVPIGVRCASLILRDVASTEAFKRGREDDGGASALLAEIKRLTLIVAPGSGAWDTIPVPDAVRAQILTDEEWGEVESALVFFMGAYWLAASVRRKEVVRSLCSMLGWQTTSSLPSEFAAGLPILTPVRDGKVEASSVPS